MVSKLPREKFRPRQAEKTQPHSFTFGQVDVRRGGRGQSAARVRARPGCVYKSGLGPKETLSGHECSSVGPPTIRGRVFMLPLTLLIWDKRVGRTLWWGKLGWLAIFPSKKGILAMERLGNSNFYSDQRPKRFPGRGRNTKKPSARTARDPRPRD